MSSSRQEPSASSISPRWNTRGGLLFPSLPYFDPVRRRPGLPEDVAALVTKVEARRTDVQLINLSSFATRDVVIQAGAFGELHFAAVEYPGRIALPLLALF